MIDRAGAAVPFAPASRPAGRPGRDRGNTKTVAARRRGRRAGRRRGRSRPGPTGDPDRGPWSRCPRRRCRTTSTSPIDGTGVPMTADRNPGPARANTRTGGPAPARSNSPPCSPRPDSTTTGTRSATRTPPATWPPSPPPASSRPWSRPRPAAAAPTTSANSSSWATAPPGSGTSPARSCPRRPRSWTSSTPASTCTTSPPPSRSSLPDPDAVARRPPGRTRRRRHRSDHRRRPRQYPLIGVKAADRDKALAYFSTNAVRMRYAHYRDLGMFIGSGAVEAGCKAVIGQRLKLSGMRWTAPAPPASSPCAANTPAAPGTRSGHTPTLRSQPPTSPPTEPDHGHLQICRTPVQLGNRGFCRTTPITFVGQ